MSEILDYITLKLTNRCNMNCYMCGQVYSRGLQTNHDLPFSLIKKKLDEINSVKTVYLFGGEPLIYRELPELLSYLRSKSMDILITTNGILLKKYTEDIMNSKVRDLTISIDSHKEDVFAKIRGNGVFYNILENLKYLIEMKKKNNSEYPYIGINCVILPENSDLLIDYYNFFMDNFPELDRINFEAPISTTLDMGQCYERILRDKLNTKADSWNWFTGKVSGYTQDNIENIKIQIEKLIKCDKVTFLAPTTNNSIEDIFCDSYVIPKEICKSSHHTLTILPDGDAVFCTDFPDYIVGNVNDSTLEELLNNEKSKCFRSLLRNSGNLPICATCPRQYDSGEFLINIKE